MWPMTTDVMSSIVCVMGTQFIVQNKVVLFRATDDNPQLALFRASTIWKNVTNL